MAKYRIEFARIGRKGAMSADFDAADADSLAEAIFRFTRKHLGSKWFDVVVDLETMTGVIEQGRFGSFTITELPAP